MVVIPASLFSNYYTLPYFILKMYFDLMYQVSVPLKSKYACDPARRIVPHYLASRSTHSGLTSLKRFQCLILRLYCEMVDSHCSSSMKFPVLSAPFTLFTSAWMAEPASITSGTRRHPISVIPTMVADKSKKSLHTPAVGLPLVRRRMLRLG